MRVAAALAAVAVGLAGCGGGGDPSPREGRADGDLAVPTAGWRTDFAKHSVPLSEFRSGGPGRDGIPPVDEPRPVPQDEAEEWLSEREPVLVVEADGAVRAYPVQILVWHEIVNDELGGEPIAVTYCPLCNSSVVFDRRVGGRTLTFGTTGNLRHSDLVMWDRQTESWWQQLTAEAVVGELTGTRLRVLPAQTLSWGEFRRLHPRADVLSRDTGARRDYGRNPYEGYDEPDSEPFLYDGKPDRRLPPKERVAAVFERGETVVYPFARLREERVVNDEVAGRPVVVLFDPDVASVLDASELAESRDVGTAAAFDRRAAGRTLDLEPHGDGFRDRQTGTTWDLAGRATAGPLRGQRLAPVRHDQQFWFALAAFVPDARIAE